MAKRRTRLTPRRKKRVPAPAEYVADPSSPSAEEWKGMQSYKSFMVKDVDGQFHKFPVGDYALIIPAEIAPTEVIELREYWVGKIKEIRSRGGDHTEVWVKVQWLWSSDDISKQKKGLDPEEFGYMERFLSNSYDFVHTSCFQGIADVISYSETSLQNKTVTNETFYYRYTYDYTNTRITPELEPSCICDELYNADDESFMHFCPRNSCQKSFHASCLQKANWTEHQRHHQRSDKRRKLEDVYAVPRNIQLQRTLPYSTIEETRKSSKADTLPDTSFNDLDLLSSPRKRRRGRPSQEYLSVKMDADGALSAHNVAHMLELLPTVLLLLAQSPMVKGRKTSLPQDTGIVAGNVAFVARAREMVDSVLIGCEDLPKDWEKILQLPSEGEGAKIEAWIASDEGLICPSCGGAI